MGDVIMGGQPITFEDITEGVETLRKFTDILFEDDLEGRWSPMVRELLVMTLLLRYDQYIEIVQSHPFARLVESRPNVETGHRYSCSTVEDNLFVIKIDRALELACGEDIEDDLRDIYSVRDEAQSTFRRWKSEVRKAFFTRNGAGIDRY